MQYSLDYLTTQTILSFLLAMFRFHGFFLVAPIFSRNQIPMIIKIGLSAIFSFCFYDLIFIDATKLIVTEPIQLGLGIFHELLIGMMLGILTSLIFDALTTVTHLMGIQSGMSSSNVFNPTIGGTTNALGLFYVTVALIFFLNFDGLYHLLFIIRKSFEIIPLASFDINFAILAKNFIFVFNQIFVISLKYVLPLISLMFIIDVFIAIFAKIMPQANMYFLAMPCKLFIAAFLLMMIMAGFSENIYEFFANELYSLMDRLFS